MADMTDSAQAASDVATPDKNAEEVAKALAKWYMACHAENPDSPKCQAVTHLMQAVAEIAGGPGSQPMDPAVEAPEGEPPMPMEDGAMSPDMAPPPEGGLPPEDMALAEEAGPPPTSIGDPAGQTQTMMLEAAKRRRAA